MKKKRKEEGKRGRSKHMGIIQYTEKMKEAMFHLVDQLSTFAFSVSCQEHLVAQVFILLQDRKGALKV